MNKEVQNEAFRDIVRGSAKAMVRGAKNLAKGVAKTITPTGYELASKARKSMNQMIDNVAKSSPEQTLQAHVKDKKIPYYNIKDLKEVKISEVPNPVISGNLPEEFRIIKFVGKTAQGNNQSGGASFTDGDAYAYIILSVDKNMSDTESWKIQLIQDDQGKITYGDVPVYQHNKRKTQSQPQSNTFPIGTRVRWQSSRGNETKGTIVRPHATDKSLVIVKKDRGSNITIKKDILIAESIHSALIYNISTIWNM